MVNEIKSDTIEMADNETWMGWNMSMQMQCLGRLQTEFAMFVCMRCDRDSKKQACGPHDPDMKKADCGQDIDSPRLGARMWLGMQDKKRKNTGLGVHRSRCVTRVQDVGRCPTVSLC
jgi:hypothetical protein